MAAALGIVKMCAGLPWSTITRYEETTLWSTGDLRLIGRSTEWVRVSEAHTLARWYTGCDTWCPCWEGCRKHLQGYKWAKAHRWGCRESWGTTAARGLEYSSVHIRRVMPCLCHVLHRSVWWWRTLSTCLGQSLTRCFYIQALCKKK